MIGVAQSLWEFSVFLPSQFVLAHSILFDLDRQGFFLTEMRESRQLL